LGVDAHFGAIVSYSAEERTRVGVRLFVGNLDYSVTEAELREHFAPVGQPSQVALPVDRETGRPRGFAFVEFSDRAVAEEVIRRFHGQMLKGRGLAISEARAREDRPFSPRPPFAGGGGGGAPAPGSGYAPRPPRPPFGGPSDGAMGGGGGPARGGDRPQRSSSMSAKAKAKQQEKGPKGPIRERGGGRMLDIDDRNEDASEEVDFDNFATSRGEGEEKEKDELEAKAQPEDDNDD
jgi:RNA recognition motif-containing protein